MMHFVKFPMFKFLENAIVGILSFNVKIILLEDIRTSPTYQFSSMISLHYNKIKFRAKTHVLHN